MEYSKIEAIKRGLVTFHLDLKRALYFLPDEDGVVPSIPTILEIDTQTRRVCSVLLDLDHNIKESALTRVRKVVLNTSGDIYVYDQDNNPMIDIQNALSNNYNPKMLAKVINCSEAVVFETDILSESLTKEQAIKLLHI